MADDDQSIDDQADTATGGLANDMPGLPMSAPGRSGAPSALGGIAQAFARMMGGAPPRPPPQPGRSPFQFPGQSQVPVQPGQPRWQGTTASLALPRGAQQPPAKFTPFMRGTPTTNYTQWGEEEQFPNLPRSFEAPSIYQGLSKFFGQNGSAAIIPLALSMGKNAGAFLEGVMQGQEWKAKMHREKLQDDAVELAQKMQQEMYTYYDTVDEYATSAGAKSGEEAKNYAINGVTMLDALAQEANKLGDDKFLAVLGTGSVDKALQFLHERNDNWRTLDKANKAADKQDAEDRSEAAIWGQAPPGTQQATGGSTNPANVYAGSTAQPTSGAAPTGKTMPADSATPQSDAPTTAPDNTPWAGDAPAVQEAERLAATGRGMKISDPRYQDYVNKQALEMQDWVDRNIIKNKAIGPDILDKDGNIISSPVEDALNKSLGGHFAEDSRGIAYYTQGLGGGQTGGGGGGGPEQNYNKLLQDLAAKRRPGDMSKGTPGYSQRNYQLITDFEKNNQVNQTVARFTNLSTTGVQLKEAVDNLPANLTKVGADGQSEFSKWVQAQSPSGLQEMMANITGGKFTGDQRFVAVATAWNNYNIEKNVLLRGGIGGQGETERAQGTVPSLFARPEDYRTALTQDAQNVFMRGRELQKRFHDLGGLGDPPGWDRDAFETTKQLANTEPVNNKQPGERVMTPMGLAIWRGYFDKNGKAIPPDKRYDPIEPPQ